MKILIYGNRKQDDDIWEIDTPEKEEAAYRELFKTLDETWQVYADLEEVEKRVLCEACKKGYHKGCEDKETCPCKSRECPAFQYQGHYEQQRQARWPLFYKQAKAGDFPAMKKLMKERSDYGCEYEQFRVAETKKAKVIHG